MKKQQPTIQHDPQIIHKKNRNRLIQQNRQLYSQIFRLQHKVSSVLTKNISNQFKQVVEQQKLDEKRKQQTKEQIVEIKKLKRKILLLKNSQKPQQKDHLRQALDELEYVKKQRQKLIYQKQALVKKRNLKNQSLQLNKPLQQDKNHLLSLYKAAQRQNFQLRTQSVKIQRDINHFHKVKQLAKTSVPKSTVNQSFEIAKIQNQLTRLRNEMKQIQKQWQPRIDSLNTQYFLLKQIVDQKQQQIQKGQKIIKTQKNRILAFRQEQEILKDKARLSNISISPEKRDQIKGIYQTQKQRQQFFEQFRSRSKNQILAISNKSKSKQKLEAALLTSSRKKKLSTSRLTTKLFSSQREDKKISPERQFPKLQIQGIKNEFEEEVDLQKSKKKQNKILNSIAVGTTFYYDENEQLE